MGLFDFFKKKESPQPPQAQQPPPKPAPVKLENGLNAVQENKYANVSTNNDASSTKYTDWRIGQTIDGLYEIFGASAGGMGAVYFVNHLKWKIPLAVKTPLPALISSSSAYKRYIKEAETWINIGMHPHIASCFYVRDIGGIPRIFIEFVSGGTLKDLIDKKRLGDIHYVLDLAIQFSMAMEYVHELGIIHRDIKPANCLITSDGELKVTDFGIAKLGDDLLDTDDNPHFAQSYEGLTMTGTGFGTPEYMAPEQFIDAKNIGKEADIYSFGVMLYEMVYGVRPFAMPAGMNNQARDYFYRNAHFNEIPKQPLESNRRIPQSLNRIIMKCLEKDVAKRFHCFSDISSVLLDCCNEAGKPNSRIKPDVLKLKADSLNNKAASFLDLGRNEEAIRCWQLALVEDPQHLESTFNYGYFRWKNGALYRDTLKSQMANLKNRYEHNSEFWKLLAWLYYEVGDIEALQEIQNSSHRVLNDEFLKLYNELNTNNGRQLRIYKGAGVRNAQAVNFSTDGKYVFSASITGLLQWDFTSGKEFTHFILPKGYVTSFVFSLEGEYALAGCERGVIILLDVVTGKEIRRFEWSGEHLDFDGFSINIERIDDDFYKRIVSKKILTTNVVNTVLFSPDNNSVIAAVSTSYTCVLTCDQNKSIHLNDHPVYNAIIQWDTSTGYEIQRFKGYSKFNSVVFSPDGQYILSGSSRNNNSDENTLRLWEITTGKDLRRFNGYNESINAVAISPDGKFAISAGELIVWELTSGKLLSRFEDSCAPVAFSPDSKFILSGSYQNDNTNENILTLRDIETGNEIRRFEAHTGRVYAIAFSPDGNCILTGGWGAIRYSSIKSFKKLEDIGIYPALTRIKSTTDIITESQKVQYQLATANQQVEKLNYREAYRLLRQAQTLKGYERDKEILDLVNYCGIQGKGLRKGLKSAWIIGSFTGHEVDVWTLNFSHDSNYILTGSGSFFSEDDKEYQNIRIWERKSGKEIKVLEGYIGCVSSVKFSSDNRYALTGGGDPPNDENEETEDYRASERTIIVWDFKTAREMYRFEVYGSFFCDFVFSPDTRHVLSWGSNEFVMRLWDVQSAREVWQFGDYDKKITSVIFSPDGKHIIAGYSDKTIIIWETASRKEFKRFNVYGVFLCDNIFDTNGKYIIFGGEGRQCVRLWEIAAGKEVRCFTGETGKDLRHAIFSPDGRFVATWGEDYTEDTLSLHEIATGKKYKCYNGSVRSVTFSHDSRYLAFSNDDKAIVLLELDWEWDFLEAYISPTKP